jgi:hypothetical protein
MALNGLLIYFIKYNVNFLNIKLKPYISIKMNYDFKSNWNDIIISLLSDKKIKKSIKKGIIDYINYGNCSEDIIYDSDKCPASYERCDGWDTYISDFEDKLTEKFKKTGYLKKPDI